MGFFCLHWKKINSNGSYHFLIFTSSCNIRNASRSGIIPETTEATRNKSLIRILDIDAYLYNSAGGDEKGRIFVKKDWDVSAEYV